MRFEAATSTAPIALHVDVLPDAIDRLPEGGRPKLLKLRLRSRDLNLLIPKWDDVHPAVMARVEAEQRLTRLREQPGRRDGFGLADSDPRVIAAAKRLEELTEAEKRLTDLQTVRSQTWREASTTLSGVEAFLKNRPGGTALKDVETPAPKLAKNEGLLDAIERHRQLCQERRVSLQKIRSAPHPSDHCKRLARTAIEELAARGKIDVGHLIQHGGVLGLPMQQVRVAIHNGAGATGFADTIDTAALFAWVFEEALLAKVDAEIDAAQQDKTALAAEVRARRDSEISDELLVTERALCSLIWRAQSENLPAEFTADINPVAILGVELVAALAVPSTGTTRGLSWAS